MFDRRYVVRELRQPHPCDLETAAHPMIQFEVIASTKTSPHEFCEAILDLNNWKSFTGHGIIPGIREVSKHSPDGNIVGTIFSVENTDASTHRETIVAYEPESLLVMHMDGFSRPLKYLASHFIEKWQLTRSDQGCRIRRSFEMHATNPVAALPLRVAAIFLRRAIRKHTLQIAAETAADPTASELSPPTVS